MSTRLLDPDDEPALRAFLARHPDTTLFMQSNLRQAGLVDRGLRYEGTYAAELQGDRIVAAAAHYWNGNVIVEAPVALDKVVAAVVGATARDVKGILGPHGQAVAARRCLGLEARAATIDSKETLLALNLARLRVPDILRQPGVVCRPVQPSDVDTLSGWHLAYAVEALGAEDSAELRAEKKSAAERAVASHRHWVLERDGALVAMSAFNAEVPECVQIGAVYTPPAHRGQGYGRAVVAGSLLEAHGRGVKRSVLFTPETNAPAQRAYQALGYKAVGEYGLILFP